MPSQIIKLSVLMPVLNGMPYLTECLASLEGQTLPNFEVLAWDNGSTDGSIEELRRWIPARIPGQVITGQPRELHLCLAALVEMSGSEICARMDADDVALPQRLERQVKFLEQHPECPAVGGQIELIDSTGGYLGLPLPTPVTTAGILFALFWRNCMSHPAMAFRRAVVLKAGNYRVSKPVEDYDLWLRLSANGRLANLTETILKYRKHGESIVGQEESSGRLAEKVRVCAATHAPAVFGVSTPGALRALKQQSRFVLPVLETVVRSVARRTGTPAGELRRSPEFLTLGRVVCARSDLLTRIYLFALEQSAGRRSLGTALMNKLQHRLAR